MSEIKLAQITFQRNEEGQILRDRDGFLVAKEVVLFEGPFDELVEKAKMEAERQKLLRAKRKKS
jgi:hypothetical protein